MRRPVQSASALGPGIWDFQEDGAPCPSSSTPCPWPQFLLCYPNTSPSAHPSPLPPSPLEPIPYSESLTAAGVMRQNHKSHASSSY